MEELDTWKPVAVLVIFASGFIGCGLPPLLSWLRERGRAGAGGDGGGGCLEFSQRGKRMVAIGELLLMSIGCGVMLSTGLVHVLPDAEENVEAVGWLQDEEEPYPLAQLMTLGAVLVVFFFHMELHHRVDHMKQPVARMHTLEVGLVVHSVLIGFAIGSTQDDHEARALTIALIFHQLCEGFAMGGAVREAATGAVGIGWLHQSVMVVLFALSTPIGVIIGWRTVSNEEEANATASVGVQAVFESLAAGVLICTSLCEFMPQLYGMGAHSHGHASPEEGEGEDKRAAVEVQACENEEAVHARDDHVAAQHEHAGECDSTRGLVCHSTWTRLMCHIGVLSGAAAMCVLAKWA